MYYGSDAFGEWRRIGRACSPDIFDIFFRLSVPKDEMSLNEMETIISLAADRQAFNEALLKLNEDGRIARFLVRFEDYTEKDIPIENIETIISVLLDIGDLFPEGDAVFVGFGTNMRIRHICYQLSHRFDAHEKRFLIFKKAIEHTTKSLYTIVDEVGIQGQEHGKFTKKEASEPVERRTITSEQLTQLESLVCEKITIWAADCRLAKHKHLRLFFTTGRDGMEKIKLRNLLRN